VARIRWTGRPTRDDRLDAELRDHAERDIAARMARGLSEADARRESRLAIGGFVQARDACLDVRRRWWLEETRRDIVLGARAWRREPTLALSIVLVLAIGIGATVAMVSVLYAVVLRPLPYGGSAGLVQLSTHLIAQDRADGTSMANLLDWRSRSRALADLTFYRRPAASTVTFAGVDAPQRAQEGLVGPTFFPLLASAPLIGRTFTASEFDRRERVVVLSEALWRDQFGGSPDVVGRMLHVDGAPHLILGVMPRTFQLPTAGTRFWRPLSLLSLWPATQSVRDGDQFEVLGRLAPGVTIDRARADLRDIAAQLRRAHAVNRNLDIRVEALADVVTGPLARRSVWLAAAAVVCLLAIACANAGGLLLARAARRRAELSVRVALGAGRARLVRQLLAEALGLWAVAAGAGVFLAWCLIGVVQAFGPQTLPRLADVTLSPLALLAALGVSALVVLACGLPPAVRAARVDAALAFGTRDPTSAPRARWRDPLVSFQIGGALVLLVGAVLFARSFFEARGQSPGYVADRLLIARIELPRHRYPDAAAVAAFFDEAAARIGGVAGVQAVGGISDFFIRRNADQWVTVRGRPSGREVGSPRLAIEGVTPGFFGAAGIRLLAGRDFEPRDYAPEAAPVCIVSESLAWHFWPDGRALGQQIVGGDTAPRDGRWRTVVGIVKDIRREGLDLPPILGAYTPAHPRAMDLVVRTSAGGDGLSPAVRQQLRSLDAALPVSQFTSAEGQLSQRLDSRRFETQALTIFSSIAILLSGVGLYATLSYQVALRQREIGIRTALGAGRRTIVLMVLQKGMRVAAAGMAGGTVCAAWAALTIRSLLYETAPVSAGSYAVAGAIVLAVVVAATVAPSWRASRIDPTTALRHP
jgi:putative ABC transport system permease protein